MSRSASLLAGRILLCAPHAFIVILMLVVPAHAQQWQMVWNDEFEGTVLDGTKWTAQIGDGTPGLPSGWGNNELQYYTAENATVGGGYLTITAKKEVLQTWAYTSARIRTLGKGEWTYGRFEMRAKLPEGQGLWPAFWMLPSSSTYGTWAASGEIDIMEIRGSDPGRVHGTIHYGGPWPANTFTGQDYLLPGGQTFADEFHLFAVEWKAGEIRWFVDSVEYATQTSWYSSGGPWPAPFDKEFHLLLNVAVGGNFPGAPDSTTQFPQTMIVDYVRVYKDALTGLNDAPGVKDIPAKVEIQHNYPNPFNPSTRFVYQLPDTRSVRLRVFDRVGREVAVLENGRRRAGEHTVTWNANGMASGVYVLKLEATGPDRRYSSSARTMVLVK